MARGFRFTAILACALWILCGVYAARFMYRGWIPHDEGTIGQSAERVLSGEVPHRDFDEVYTGGLTYLHAAGMKVLGVKLRAPRLVLLAFFMAFLAAVYAIARQVASSFAALVAMALGAVWTVPNYFVSLPSWYNLFFATFGILAFLRYFETERRRWLVLAGIFGGLSLLAKIAGLFYLAGGLLVLMYVEQTVAGSARPGRHQRSGFAAVAAIPAILFLLLIVKLALSQATSPDLLQLFAPAVAICVFLVWRERTMGIGGAVLSRTRHLLEIAWPFVVGASIPVVAFVLFCWQQHAVADLVRGVFVLPQRRLAEAAMNPPAIATIGLAVPYALLLFVEGKRGIRLEWFVLTAASAAFALVLAFGQHPVVYRAVWAIVRAMPMVAVAAGLWRLARESVRLTEDVSASKRAQIFLLVTMAAFVSLVQFPYATPTYFYYAAPVTILAIVALTSIQAPSFKRMHVCVAAFCFLFAVGFTNRSYGSSLGVQFFAYQPTGRLDLDRGGLWVPAEDKRVYEELVAVLKQHASGGTIYAGPDCPEVYFLSGFPNPTRAIFDFLTPLHEDESWMANLLAHAPIRAAVINEAPLFSAALDRDARALLERRFPSARRIGRFVVRFE